MCKYCNTDKNIIHSGVDGLYLGCLDDLHNICYDCGNKLAFKIKSNKIY